MKAENHVAKTPFTSALGTHHPRSALQLQNLTLEESSRQAHRCPSTLQRCFLGMKGRSSLDTHFSYTKFMIMPIRRNLLSHPTRISECLLSVTESLVNINFSCKTYSSLRPCFCKDLTLLYNLPSIFNQVLC